MTIYIIEHIIYKYQNKAVKYTNFVKYKIIWNNIFKIITK